MTNHPKATKEFVQQVVAQTLCANTLSPITIVQMPSAQLMWTIKTLYLVVALKSRILCYNIFSVGIGPAKATV